MAPKAPVLHTIAIDSLYIDRETYRNRGEFPGISRKVTIANKCLQPILLAEN